VNLDALRDAIRPLAGLGWLRQTRPVSVGLVVLALGVLVMGTSLYLGAQRRLDEARAAEQALRAENARLQRAVGAAEQSMRSLAADPRLDTSLALEVDMALDHLRRVSGELDPPH
jgi:hypothetical protein